MKLAIWAAVLGLLPFVVFLGVTSHQLHNGELVAYSYLNFAAIAGGGATVAVAVAMARRPYLGELRPPRPGWVLPVCAVLIVLGAVQLVRGAGFFPMILGCETESGTMGFCRPAVVG
ncbi:hypothetical protein [Actinophytocola gossypii]|uniref:hypothetical protein n=1 Tax=Actinophytocola gossypii TaxID=2812003 RepID=UPI0021A56A9D|nr:hypothetical protein [Actinophytocola gossypii]